MGKTHLMQAIGHEIKLRQPEESICYVSSERFTNEMINALRYSKMTGFRDKYRNMVCCGGLTSSSWSTKNAPSNILRSDDTYRNLGRGFSPFPSTVGLLLAYHRERYRASLL